MRMACLCLFTILIGACNLEQDPNALKGPQGDPGKDAVQCTVTTTVAIGPQGQFCGTLLECTTGPTKVCDGVNGEAAPAIPGCETSSVTDGARECLFYDCPDRARDFTWCPPQAGGSCGLVSSSTTGMALGQTATVTCFVDTCLQADVMCIVDYADGTSSSGTPGTPGTVCGPNGMCRGGAVCNNTGVVPICQPPMSVDAGVPDSGASDAGPMDGGRRRPQGCGPNDREGDPWCECLSMRFCRTAGYTCDLTFERDTGQCVPVGSQDAGTPADVGPTPDSGICTTGGGVGCPCQDRNQCLNGFSCFSNLCVQAPDGGVFPDATVVDSGPTDGGVFPDATVTPDSGVCSSPNGVGCACTSNSQCLNSLSCISNICVQLPDAGFPDASIPDAVSFLDAMSADATQPADSGLCVVAGGTGCVCTNTLQCLNGYTCLSNLCVQVPDAGQPDASAPDAMVVDASSPDAMAMDAAMDAGVMDTGTVDSGMVDSGAMDSGTGDGGTLSCMTFEVQQGWVIEGVQGVIDQNGPNPGWPVGTWSVQDPSRPNLFRACMGGGQGSAFNVRTALAPFTYAYRAQSQDAQGRWCVGPITDESMFVGTRPSTVGGCSSQCSLASASLNMLCR